MILYCSITLRCLWIGRLLLDRKAAVGARLRSEAEKGSGMSKPPKAAAELVALLNAELRKQDACVGVSVDAVTPVAEEKAGFTCTPTILRRSGGPIPGQCSRFFVAALRLLQQRSSVRGGFIGGRAHGLD